MTNLEALKAKLSYPLADNAFILALLNRGLVNTEDYTSSNLQQLELSHADLIHTLVTAPDVTEGGYHITLSDKKTLILLANGIYSKYGQSSPLKATATFKSIW